MRTNASKSSIEKAWRPTAAWRPTWPPSCCDSALACAAAATSRSPGIRPGSARFRSGYPGPDGRRSVRSVVRLLAIAQEAQSSSNAQLGDAHDLAGLTHQTPRHPRRCSMQVESLRALTRAVSFGANVPIRRGRATRRAMGQNSPRAFIPATNHLRASRAPCPSLSGRPQH